MSRKPRSKPRQRRNPAKASRPWVVVNMSMSADGKIASANRRVIRLGSDRDLQSLYQLRSTADALLCGSRTVEETRATLGNGGQRFRQMRRRRGLAEYPLRIVASASGSLSPTAAIWSRRFSPILVLTTQKASTRRLEQLRTLADRVWIRRGTTVNFAVVLQRLHRDFRIRRLVVEGGGQLNATLFRAGLVDEVHLTICPLLVGGRDAPTIADGVGFARLSFAPRFRLDSWNRRGNELFAVFRKSE